MGGRCPPTTPDGCASDPSTPSSPTHNLDTGHRDDGVIGNSVVYTVEHALGDGPWDIWAIEFEAAGGA